VRCRLALALLWAGETAAAREVLAAAQADAGARCDEVMLARVALVECQARLGDERMLAAEEMRADVDHAAAVLERAGDHAGLAEACLVRFLLSVRGDLGGGEEALEEGLRHARAAGARFIENDLLAWLMITLRRGVLPVADAARRAREVLDEVPRRAVRAATLSTLSLLHAMQGEFDEARALALETEDVLRELGLTVGVVAHAMARAEVEILAGDLDAAERILREGARRNEAFRDTTVQANIGWELAVVLLRRGRDEEALESRGRARAMRAPRREVAPPPPSRRAAPRRRCGRAACTPTFAWSLRRRRRSSDARTRRARSSTRRP
jgi:tetratricopeptide (TPR) repeat protein